MKRNTLKGKTLLLVNTGSTHKRHVLKRLKQLDIHLVALNKDKNWAQPYVDEWILTDNSNHNQALLDLDKYLKEHTNTKIDGVITFWEDDVLLTSKIVDRYNLIGIPLNIANQVRNKFKFREFCAAQGLPFPKFKAVKNNEDLDYINKNFKYPLVIKPAFGSQSNFVAKVTTEEELDTTYKYIRSNISTNVESALADGLEIFVEEYIEGDEVDIDLLLQNGKVKFAVVSDNFDKTFNEFFLDKGQSAPSSLSEDTQQSLIELCEDTLEKLGIYNGCIHYEAKATKNGPFPIEVNMRMGGDYVWSYIKDAWGVDLIEYAVKIAVGEHIKFPKNMQPKKYVIGWDLHPEESGILAELNIPDELEQLPYVEEVNMYKDIGEPVLVPPESTDTIGWITVSGENFLDAQDNLQKVLSDLEFKVVKFDSESALGKTVRKNRYASAKINRQILINAARIERLKLLDKQSLKKLHIGLVANIDDFSKDPIDEELSTTAKAVHQTLLNNGYQVLLINATEFQNIIRNPDFNSIDLILNLSKKLNNSAFLGAQFPTFFEAMNLPFVGSDTATGLITKDKIKFKKILNYHEIPTADWDYVYDADEEVDDDLCYPLIVKPAIHDNSIGITDNSIVHNEKDLRKQIKIITEKFKSPAIIEEYIEGDEYRISIIGNSDSDLQILPVSRTIFSKLPNGYSHIYTYEAKWGSDKAYKKLELQYPVKNINKKLETLLSEIALNVFNIMKCKDYACIELRVDEYNNPYVLELDTNPSLNISSELAKASAIAEIGYLEMIEEIILAAVNRYQKVEKNVLNP